METLTVQITEDMKQYVERQIATGAFNDSSAVVGALFSVTLLEQEREEIDRKLLEAVDQVERGDCAPWQPGGARKLLQEIVRQRGSNGKPEAGGRDRHAF